MIQKKKDWILGLGIAGGTLVLIFLLVNQINRTSTIEETGYSSGGDKVAVIELFGTIYDSRKIVQQFERYGEQKSIKAIVFRIESPGGSVSASQEIYEAVRRVRDGGKPVIASMGNVAASGGYYVACGTDTIMANPGTTTGSIGVVAEFVNAKELFKKLGMKIEVVKSGRFKDTGSPHRDFTEDDKRYLQSWVDDAFEQFVEVVVRERRLPKERVIQLADGRVFTGKQALDYKLIDLLGDYHDAVILAAKLGNIKGKPSLVKETRRRITLFDLLFEQIEEVLRGMNGIQLKYSLN